MSPLPPSVVLTVTDPDGAPVAGAKVGFVLTGGALAYDFQSGHGTSPSTDARGRIDLDRVIPGSYAVTVEAHGYQPLSENYRYAPGAPGDILRLTVRLIR